MVFLSVSIFLTASVKQVPGDFDKIQSAIDNSNEGDTIIVSEGLYYENIVLQGKKNCYWIEVFDNRGYFLYIANNN